MASEWPEGRRGGVGDHATGHVDVLRQAVSVGVVGASIGAVQAVVAMSFAALIFAGPLPHLLPTGLGLALFGGAALLVVTGLLATVPGTVASVQDAPAVILAVVVAAVVAEVGPAAVLPTVLVTVVLASLAVGGTFFMLGVLRLGDLVRYVPFPVIGGFLAGTGWLILRGGASFLTEDGSSGSLVGAVGSPVLGVGVGLGVLLLVGTQRWGAAVTMPAVIVGATVVFHVVVAVGAGDLTTAARDGWVLTGVPDGRLWPPVELGSAAAIDWGAVVGNLPGIASLLAIGTLSLLLNASGIELSARRDLDFDRELRVAGVANVVASLGGGFPGYQSVGLTGIAHGAQLFRRSVALVAAGVLVAVMLFGGGLVALLPRPVLGAVLVFLGLTFLQDWLVRGRTRMTLAEYLVVVLITVVIGLVGVIEGVLVGLMATLVLFAASYSAMDVVRHRMTLASCRSTVDRPPDRTAVLDAHGDAVVVLELQGFLFFGTARRLLDLVRAELAASSDVAFLVIDLQRVTGLDSSSGLAFARVSQLLGRADVQLVVAGASPEHEALLRRQEGVDATARFTSDLDRAVQWCEEQILQGIDDGGAPISAIELLTAALGRRDLATRLLGHMQRLEVGDGEEFISEGGRAHDLFVLVEGTVTASITVPRGGALRLRTMLPGTVVGEMAMYRGTTRTAAVVAEGDATVLHLSAAAVQRLEAEDPEVATVLHRWLARQLADRLTASLATIAALQG